MGLAIDRAAWADNGLRNRLRHPPNDAILYYPGLRGGTHIVEDYSGKGNHGTLVNTTQVRSSGGIYGLGFDGDDQVDCGNDATLQLVSDFTFMAMVRRGAAGAFHTIAGKFDTDGNQRGWLFEFVNNDTIDFTISKTGLGAAAATILATVATYTSTTALLHVACSYQVVGDGSSVMDITVNGVQVATTALAVSPLFNSSENLKLGVMQIANVDSRFYVGDMYVWSLVNAYMTTAQIAYHYDNELRYFKV